jgi:hypothetical protein
MKVLSGHAAVPMKGAAASARREVCFRALLPSITIRGQT